MASPSSHLSEKSEVEIRSEEPGLKGAWFTGTVLRTPTRRKTVSVQFKTLLDEKGKKPLKEYVDLSNVRPVPPQEAEGEADRGFEVGDVVDAYTNDGWWEGVVTKLVDDSSFMVQFKETDEELVFAKKDLRVHKDWVDGSWVVPEKVAGNLEKASSAANVEANSENQETRVPDVDIRGSFKVDENLDTDTLEQQLDEVTKKRKELQQKEIDLQAIIMARKLMEKPNKSGSQRKRPKKAAPKANAQIVADTNEHNSDVQNEQQDNDASKIKNAPSVMVTSENASSSKSAAEFKEGMLVEVSSEAEGSVGAWFTGVIVQSAGDDKYLVEYKSNENELLREEVDNLHIRHEPPAHPDVDCFSQSEEVDARYSNGWWSGVISKVVSDKMYSVHLKEKNEELEFGHSDLRLHYDWVDGKWTRPSQAIDRLPLVPGVLELVGIGYSGVMRGYNLKWR